MSFHRQVCKGIEKGIGGAMGRDNLMTWKTAQNVKGERQQETEVGGLRLVLAREHLMSSWQR